MVFTIKETQVDDPGSLCGSCSKAHIFTNEKGTRIRYCRVIERNIHYPVTQCTSYAERGALTRYEMEQIAWILEVSPRRKAGFMPPKDHGRKPRAHLDLEGDVDYDDIET